MRLFKIFTALLLIVIFTASCTVNINYPENGVVDYITDKEYSEPTTNGPDETEDKTPHTESANTDQSPKAEEETSDIGIFETEEALFSDTDEYIPPIHLIYLSSPISKNQTAEIDILGLPFTEYSIEVFYATGKSSASGLENKISNENGKVSWSWKIGPSVKSGYYKIVVTGGGTSLETEIQVY